MPKLRKLRLLAVNRQHGLCFYCRDPMWEKAVETDETFAKRHRIKPTQARMFLATAEHLTARCDGGRETEANVAAACVWCNARRHRRLTPPAADRYSQLVQHRMNTGRWRPLHLPRTNRIMPIAGQARM